MPWRCYKSKMKNNKTVRKKKKEEDGKKWKNDHQKGNSLLLFPPHTDIQRMMMVYRISYKHSNTNTQSVTKTQWKSVMCVVCSDANESTKLRKTQNTIISIHCVSLYYNSARYIFRCIYFAIKIESSLSFVIESNNGFRITNAIQVNSNSRQIK